ncbi:MAG: Ca2+-binding EF-hand superfamily protein [Cellvibrionaceae bacterium]|jgi:Ca2+-binding EF-hand superfamily protein
MLTDLQKAKFTKHFQIRDTDNDGFVTQNDYHKLTENIASILGWEANHSKKTQIDGIHHGVWEFFWKPADYNDDGRVSLEDHLTMMDSMVERSKEPEVLDQSRRHSQVLFETFDFGGNGQISAKEYGQFFKAAGVEAEWTDDVFKRLDMNSNGSISLDEFVLLHQQFFSSNDPDAPGNWFYGPL